MPRLLAIGDVHGCCNSLKHLADFVRFKDDDCIVTLGDYVDRGPDSKGVVDFLIELDQHSNLHCLKGNHEIMMRGARDDRSLLVSWTGVGGDKTLESHRARNFDDIPSAHWKFLEGLLPYYETENFIFVHANAHPEAPMDEQPDYMLFWERLEDPPPHHSGKVVICGHTSQKSGIPLNFGHAVCIDTFAHGGGWLTCLDVLSGRYWQANEAGDQHGDVIAM